MDSLVRNFLIASNFFAVVQLIDQPAANSTRNTTKTHSGDTGSDEESSRQETIALVIGIALTVIILGCLGFFLIRGQMNLKRYQNHRQLVKLKQIKENGRYRKKEEPESFAEEKL